MMENPDTSNQPRSSFSARNWRLATSGVVVFAFCGIIFLGRISLDLVLGLIPDFEGILVDLGSSVLQASLFAFPALIGLWLPKDLRRYNKWRGISRMFFILAGYTLVTGVVAAFETSQPYPGIPDFILPLTAISYGLLVFFISGYHRISVPWSMGWLALAFGFLLSIGWVMFGALGRLTELGAAVGIGIALGFNLSIMLNALVHYEPDLPQRRPVLSIFYIWFAAMILPVFAPYPFAGQSALLRSGWPFLGLLIGVFIVVSQKEKPGEAWWPVADLVAVVYGLALAFTNGVEADFMLEALLLPYTAAIGVTLLLSFLAGVLLFTARKRLAGMRSRTSAALLGFMVLLAIGLYFLIGQPGIQPEAFIVILNDQADSSEIQNIEDFDERRSALYGRLTAHAKNTQVDLRAWLDAREVDYTPFYLVNSIAVRGSVLTRWQVSRQAGVDYILSDYLARPIHSIASNFSLDAAAAAPLPPPGGLPWGIDRIDAEKVWQEIGVEGEGIIVGNADSGVDWQHPAVATQYRGSERDHDYTWFDPRWGSPVPAYTGAHGTHTLGTTLGQGGIGVAPGATWIACRNLPTNRGRVSDYIACMQFLFAPFPVGGDAFTDGDVTRGAHVTNNSWGCPPEEGCDGFTMPIAIQHLRNAGQMMVVSAGNDGPSCSTIGVPATADQAFSVGAINESGLVTGFSSRGPVLFDGTGTLKPDIVAPGEGVYSSIPNGGYAYFPGTSMAGPHVTGVVALMWSANPELIGKIDATEQILVETAEYRRADSLCGADDGVRNNVYGYGIVNALKAVEAALAFQP